MAADHQQALNNCDIFEHIPVGTRFITTDQELIVHYLVKKVYGEPPHPHRIWDAQVYAEYPCVLYNLRLPKYEGISARYFFTERDRKHANGVRVSRTVKKKGFWKLNGENEDIKYKGVTIGTKKTLKFHMGNSKKSKATEWLMHEYVLSDELRSQRQEAGHKIQHDCILCRIYTNRRSKKARRNAAVQPYPLLNDHGQVGVQQNTEQLGQDQDEPMSAVEYQDPAQVFHSNNDIAVDNCPMALNTPFMEFNDMEEVWKNVSEFERVLDTSELRD